MAQSSPLWGPGIFWVGSRLAKPDQLSYETYVKWYENVHIPEFVHAVPDQPLPAAWRYQCLDETGPVSFLAVYKFPDLAAAASPSCAYFTVSLSHPSFPGGGSVTLFCEFDMRFARHSQSWKSSRGAGKYLVSEAVEVAETDGDAFKSWYGNEYVRQHVSRQPGWVRTDLFEIVVRNQMRDESSEGDREIQPTWLAMHVFDKEPGPVPATLRSVLATRAKQVEMAPFEFVRVYGDGTAAMAGGVAAVL